MLFTLLFGLSLGALSYAQDIQLTVKENKICIGELILSITMPSIESHACLLAIYEDQKPRTIHKAMRLDNCQEKSIQVTMDNQEFYQFPKNTPLVVGFFSGSLDGEPLSKSAPFSCSIQDRKLDVKSSWTVFEQDQHEQQTFTAEFESRKRLEFFPFGCDFHLVKIVDRANPMHPHVIMQIKKNEDNEMCAINRSSDIINAFGHILEPGTYKFDVLVDGPKLKGAIRIVDLCVSSNFWIEDNAEPKSYNEATLLKYLYWSPAEITDSNLFLANSFVSNCLGNGEIVWIDSFNGSKPDRECLVLVGTHYEMRPFESSCSSPKRTTLYTKKKKLNEDTKSDSTKSLFKIDKTLDL